MATAWVNVTGRLKQTDVRDNEVWEVNNDNDMFKQPADGSGSWKHIRARVT